MAICRTSTTWAASLLLWLWATGLARPRPIALVRQLMVIVRDTGWLSG